MLDQLARRQHGVIARTQTTLSEASWRRAIDSGTLVRIHDGVARLVGTADTVEQFIVAGVLASGPGALASHRSAAHLHGIPGLDTIARDCVDVIVPARRDRSVGSRSLNVVGHDSVIVHRPRDMRRLRPHRVNGIACTSILRTLVDLGAVAPEAVHGAVGHVLVTQLATLAAIETAVIEHSERGRHGISALRAAIDDWVIDGKPADSVLEPAMHRLIARHRLPPVEFHPMVGGREVDFRVIGTPIVIECDGWLHHGRAKSQFDRDRDMDAEFLARGWLVVRFTYRDITQRPAIVADKIERAIAVWANHPAPDAA